MATVMSGIGVVLQKEMARAATQIPPPVMAGPYPYIEQVRKETQSSNRVLRDAITSMVTHCAGPCCLARNEFNHKCALHDGGAARL